MRTCYFCKGPVHRRSIEYMGKKSNGYYLVKDVDAEVCDNCGETYLGPESVELIDSAWERITEAREHLQVPVVHGSD